MAHLASAQVKWWPFTLMALSVPGPVQIAGAEVPDPLGTILSDTVPATLELTLGGAARLAAERSASVAAARSMTEGLRAERAGVESGFWPQISAYLEDGERTFNPATFGIPTTIGPKTNHVIGPIRTIDLRGELQQTIFNWNLIQRLRGARAEVSAGELRAEAVQDSIAGVAARAYIDWLQAAGELRARESDLELANQLLDVARAQLAAGVGVRLDQTRAEAQVARTRAEVVSTETGEAEARLALLRIMDLPSDTRLEPLDSLGAPLLPVPTRAEAVSFALENRSDLRALDAEIRAERIGVSAIRAERLPFLTFEGDNGWTGTSFDRLLRTYTWNFKVSIPIFNGFARRAEVQAQQASVRVLEARREELRREVVFEVEQALLQLRAASSQLAANQAALRLARAEVAEAEARFSAGVAGNADVVTAALLLSDARTALVDALAGQEAARVALARAQGVARDLP